MLPPASCLLPPVFWPLLVALALSVVTEVPYVLGYAWAPPGQVFDGFVGLSDDQNMYFSFIRQGAEGKWLFVNRLTHLDHAPALLNVQWLAAGWVMELLGGSGRWAYFVWRVAGIGALVFGFWTLAGVVLRNAFLQKLSLLMCAFGGGFGWLVLILERTGLVPRVPQATLDLSDLVHPFGQMLVNPHLSLSHGLSLFFLAAFCQGERTGRPRWYGLAAAIAALHGLVRPYDLILLCGILPAFVFLDAVWTRTFSWRTAGLRLLPLLVIAPVLLYHVVLFRQHPVFKYWASQGEVKVFDPFWHYFAFGLAGVLLLLRLILGKRHPLASSGERLLLVWIAGVLILFHAHRLPWFGFMPYTPVFGVTLVSVMLVLGAPLLGSLESSSPASSRLRNAGLVAALVLVNSPGSAIWLAKVGHNLRSFPDHYYAASERAAFHWLEAQADENDVVLSTLGTGNRMARFVSARMVLGHWSVTPNVKELTERVERFYRGELTPAEAGAFLDELHVRWIYVGPEEQKLGNFDPGTIPGVIVRYDEGEARVDGYESNRMARPSE